MSAAEEDFEVVSPTEVRHRRTGATWTRMPTGGGGWSDLLAHQGNAGRAGFPSVGELHGTAHLLLEKLSGRGPVSPKGWT